MGNGRGARIIVALALLAFDAQPASARGLTQLLEKEQTLWQSLLELSTRLRQAQLQLSKLSSEGAALSYQDSEAKRRSAALRRRIDLRRSALSRRLVALYKLVRGRHAQLVVEATSWQAAFRRAGALRQIVRRDLGELRLFQRELATLGAEQTQLQQRQAAGGIRATALSTLVTRLSLVTSQQRAELQQTHLRRTRSQKRASQLTRTQRRLMVHINALKSGSDPTERFAAAKGTLRPPVACRQLYGFAGAKDPATRLPVARAGLSYRCERPRAVAAVQGGTVRYAGPLDGYGVIVVIDHGDGYQSIYGHLVKTTLQSGALVAARTRLGTTGIDPLTGHSGLYFELRHHQKPIDPGPWLRR